METISPLAQALNDYGTGAIIAVLVVVIAKLYKDVMDLNKETRSLAQESSRRDAQVVEILNRNTDALQQNASTMLEMKLALQSIRALMEKE